MIRAPHHPEYKYRSKNKAQGEMTAKPNKYPQGYFKEKPCRNCSALFKPQAPSHLYCSQKCADEGNTTNRLQKLYGVNLKQVLKMYEEQGGKCKICRTEGFKLSPNADNNLVVDHCHINGGVRGMLCHNCNRALGMLQDNVEYLKSAIEYIEDYEKTLKVIEK